MKKFIGWLSGFSVDEIDAEREEKQSGSILLQMLRLVVPVSICSTLSDDISRYATTATEEQVEIE